MTPRPLPTLVLVLALGSLLAAPLAAAEQGSVSAQAALYRGGAKVHGNAVAFFLVDHVKDPDAVPLLTDAEPAGGDPVLGIEIDARELEVMLFESHHVAAAEDAVLQADPRYPTAAAPERHVLEKATGQLVSQQADFQLTLLPSDPLGTIPFRANTQAGRMDPFDSLAMGTGNFREATAADEDGRDPGSPEFWQVRVDAPLIVHEDQAAQTDVTFTGDFVLELLGAALEVEGKDGGLAVDTGVWRDPSAGTGLPLDQPAVYAQRTVFARLTLIEAKVRVTVQGGSPGLYLAAPDLVSEHAGEVTLEAATGFIDGDGQTTQLDGGRYVLPPGHALAAGRDADRLAFTVAPAAAPAGANAGNQFPSKAPGTLAASAAVLALLAAAGLGLARRMTATPDIRQVEAAIEGQRFGRAARLAKRILRARPASEDAMLGRAIALSRGGRAGAAIAEIHDHLAKRDPSDGALHYVLGLAFLDVGREPEARTALAEAVRRTPALQSDVLARLGQQDSSGPPPTPLPDVHGYA